MKHPIQPLQPLQKDEHGTIRFKPNSIVQYLLDNGGLDMNDIAINCQRAPDEDKQQFAQLIGYSLSGYGELSYVDDYAYEVAVNMFEHGMTEDKARITYLELQLTELKRALKDPISRLFEIHPDDFII